MKARESKTIMKMMPDDTKREAAKLFMEAYRQYRASPRTRKAARWLVHMEMTMYAVGYARARKDAVDLFRVMAKAAKVAQTTGGDARMN